MKKVLVIAFALVLTFALAGLTLAGKVPTPTDPPEGVQMISADDAKDLIIAGKAIAFDMRKALNYGKGHLPGAVSLPYKWTSKGHPAQRTGEFDMSKLPEDKNVPIVFHSDGPNGWKSYYASKAAVEAGHKNVLWMREGYATWSEKGYPVEN
jgi:rhodanese-related sulfurtransferase